MTSPRRYSNPLPLVLALAAGLWLLAFLLGRWAGELSITMVVAAALVGMLAAVGAMCWALGAWILNPLRSLQRSLAEDLTRPANSPYQSPLNGVVDGVYALQRRWHRQQAAAEQERQQLTDSYQQQAAELTKARDAATAAARLRAEFLANMSHEIRTPLNAVLGMTSLLLDTHLDERQQEYTEIIRSSSDALLGIINDILDLSKIEADRLELDNREWNLREVLEGAIDLVAVRAAEKGLALAYLVADRTPEAVVCDVTRLRQVLVNLLNNAVKFTEHGQIVLGVEADLLEARQQPLYELHFSVRDTGIGIEPDKMNRLFQPFSQLDPSTSRRYGGTGLGLAISKRLCEQMDGALWVESTLGEGSIFHFTVQVQQAVNLALTNLGEPQSALVNKTALIINFNPADRRLLAKHTQTWGMRVIDTAAVEEARRWINQGSHFDMVILDLQTPELNELMSLARDLQKNHLKDAHLVGVVPLGDRTYSEVAMNAGVHFSDIVSKPIKPLQLCHTLLDLDEPRQHRQRPVQDTPTFDGSMGRRLPLRILLAEDNANNQKLGLMLLERLGYRADVAANGLEVLTALERQRYDVILMDLQMPEMDGLETTREILQRWGQQRPYLVAVTANAMQEDRELCLQTGMDDYISKPIRIPMLVHALEVVGQARQVLHLADVVQVSEGEAPHPRDLSPVLETKAIARLEAMVGGAEYLGELIDTFLEDLPQMLDRLDTAIQTMDAKTVRLVSHSLKSNSADYGAEQLQTICGQLEHQARNGNLDGASELFAQIQEQTERVVDALAAVREG